MSDKTLLGRLLEELARARPGADRESLHSEIRAEADRLGAGPEAAALWLLHRQGAATSALAKEVEQGMYSRSEAPSPTAEARDDEA
jgi:hypothetical protein